MEVQVFLHYLIYMFIWSGQTGGNPNLFWCFINPKMPKCLSLLNLSMLHNFWFSSKSDTLLGQVSRMTGILEVERSLDSCTLAVHRPLAYFRSANVKTFCKYTKFIIKDVNYCKNFLQITKDGCNNNNDDYDKIRIKRVLLLSKKIFMI